MSKKHDSTIKLYLVVQQKKQKHVAVSQSFQMPPVPDSDALHLHQQTEKYH